MKQGSRAADGDFADDELVVARWYSNWNDNGVPRAAQIEVPDQSVNRMKHRGRSWYVLLPESGDKFNDTKKWLCMGIIQLSVGKIPRPFEFGGFHFAFRVEHDPTTENYHHSEIRIYRDGIRLLKREADKLSKKEKEAFTAAKKWFRIEMAKEIITFLKAEIGTADAT